MSRLEIHIWVPARSERVVQAKTTNKIYTSNRLKWQANRNHSQRNPRRCKVYSWGYSFPSVKGLGVVGVGLASYRSGEGRGEKENLQTTDADNSGSLAIGHGSFQREWAGSMERFATERKSTDGNRLSLFMILKTRMGRAQVPRDLLPQHKCCPGQGSPLSALGKPAPGTLTGMPLTTAFGDWSCIRRFNSSRNETFLHFGANTCLWKYLFGMLGLL